MTLPFQKYRDILAKNRRIEKEMNEKEMKRKTQ